MEVHINTRRGSEHKLDIGSLSRTTKITILSVLFLLFVLHGCIMIPIPTSETKVLSGQHIGDEELLFIKQGITTKDDIVARLGEPDVLWVDQRIFAYNWEMRQAVMPWAIGHDAGIEEIGKDYVLLIQFDQNDFVKRFEVTTRSLFDSYGEHLIEWVEQTEEVQPARAPD